MLSQGQALKQSCQVCHPFPQTDDFFPQGFEPVHTYFPELVGFITIRRRLSIEGVNFDTTHHDVWVPWITS